MAVRSPGGSASRDVAGFIRQMAATGYVRLSDRPLPCAILNGRKLLMIIQLYIIVGDRGTEVRTVHPQAAVSRLRSAD